ncbi:uncharacterized protein LOC136096576 [Hydra vulgaris]|uniref:uncharacterized protein LOC136096576 n=1 Tax=Hydra vulgaris TaxID=6087 RepID=UPI0032EA1420
MAKYMKQYRKRKKELQEMLIFSSNDDESVFNEKLFTLNPILCSSNIKLSFNETNSINNKDNDLVRSSDESSLLNSDIVQSKSSSLNFNLKEKLAICAIKHRGSSASINEILEILQGEGLQVPKDYRTLLHTPCRTSVVSKCGGEYVHFGLRNGILKVLSQIPECTEIKLNFNVDGIPLFKSSSCHLWPILCKFSTGDIFICSLFCGVSKPNSLNDFLNDFLNDYKDLHTNGLIFN